jgi:hypothetical protein
MRRSRLIYATLVLGLLSLAILAAGRGVAIVLLISIIGIPLYVVMAAIPPLFLLCGLTLIFFLALEGVGNRPLVPALGLAVVAMLAIPAIANHLVERKVAALVAGDRTASPKAWQGGTLALFVRPGLVEACGDVCQRALASGAAQRVIIARSAKTWPEPDFAARGTAYRLERREYCDAAEVRDGHREVPVEPQAEPAAPGLRLLVARGHCLVSEPAPVAAADGVLTYATLDENGRYGASLDPFAAPRTVTRMAFFAAGAGGPAEIWRQTSVRYFTLFPVLIPGLVHLYGLDMAPGLWRTARTAGAPGEGPDVTGFLRQALRMNLDLPDTDVTAARDALLAEALRAPTGFDGAKQALVEDVFDAFEYNRSGTPAAVQRALSLLKDERVAIPLHLSGLVGVAFRIEGADRHGVAEALFDRLDAEARSGPVVRPESKERVRSLQRLAAGVQKIPDSEFARYWPRLRVLRDRFDLARPFAGQIRRASLAGTAALDDLIALIDLQHVRGKGLSADQRDPVLLGALSGLCGIGAAASGRLAEIEMRLKSGVIATRFPKHWRGVTNTLAALGGDPGALRGFVAPERILSNLVREFDEAIAAAARRPRCDFGA